MKTLVSLCKLESDEVAKFAVRLKSQSEQYKTITLGNVIDASVLMECTPTVLLSKYLGPIVHKMINANPRLKVN